MEIEIGEEFLKDGQHFVALPPLGSASCKGCIGVSNPDELLCSRLPICRNPHRVFVPIEKAEEHRLTLITNKLIGKT